jgi:hypothetical protein
VGEDEIDSGLRLSSRRVGRLYPVLLDKHGNVIDGKHRLAADANWPKMRLDHVESEEDRLIARLICNVCRRNVSAEEKSEILQELGELHVKAGVKPGAELASKISEETGMSYRWVMKYLPDNFKERPGVGGPSPIFNLTNVKEKIYESKVACHTTLQLDILLVEPAERVLTVKKYANTDFVNVVLQRRFYANVENLAENFGTTPDIIINNVLVSTVRKLMEASSLNRLAP